MDHKSVLVMKHQPIRARMESISTESFIERILGWLFPPKLQALDKKGIYLVGEYHERMNRRGEEPKRAAEGELQYAAVVGLGPIIEHTRPLTKWEVFENGLKKRA